MCIFSCTNTVLRMKKVSFLIALLLPYTASLAGTITSTTNTNELLNSLSGENGFGSNAYYIGSDLAVGSFTNSPNQFSLSKGIILSTGNVQDYSGNVNTSGSNSTSLNTSGYAPLSELAGVPTNDAARFGFDFQSTSNKVSFDFVFGSEEYPEYVGSSFNDAFGVFITDEDGNVQQVAKDNAGQAITINSSFMQDGSDGELDGTTGKLHVDVSLTAGKNYSIEFAIADGGDSSYDSTAFISQLEGIAEVSDPVEIRGLFVGANETRIKHNLDLDFSVNDTGMKGEDMALTQAAAFMQLANANKDEIKVIGDSYTTDTILFSNAYFSSGREGGLDKSTVLESLDEGLALVDDNDIFVFSLTGHGGSTEPYDTDSENGIVIGEGESGYLRDKELANILSKHPDVEKWVLLDGCLTGGFWDELATIPNVSFLSAVDGSHNTTYWADTGYTQFGLGVEDALRLDGSNFISDINKDGLVSFDEFSDHVASVQLANWFTDVELVYATDDILPSDLYEPVDLNKLGTAHRQSNSPSGGQLSSQTQISSLLSPTTVPEPSTLLLFAMSCSFIFYRRKKLIKGML